ncbi:DNA primase [Aquibaculum arenosum]|uniref:DNA primase n=1 Tax=Aquibaculum arenosum TaxID=3032591 RepID=A0ABT5YNC4_9PROT|nr:DNA primase [Fodinicurvata sp. CAU 1616]MDF2096342.1 DNA primase [Fodinicurvata sp. CAU 1616]
MSTGDGFPERLRDAIAVSELVGRHVRLQRRGREFTGLCPFHSEKSPSFTVNDDKQFFHCFGCGAHGDVIGWVMRWENLSYPEALERLAEQAGIPMPERTPQARQAAERRATLYEVLEKACLWFEQQLAVSSGSEARRYLEGRGLTPETIGRFRLGYAPGQRGLLRAALKAQGIHDSQLVEAGLLKQPEEGGELRDYFFGRVIFPITDRQGRVIAFGGRALSSDARAKYLNSPDTPLFDKGRVLYNLHHARRAAADGAPLLVVEGYMDVIALAQAGFPGCVAPLGTAVTEDQLQELWRMAPEPVICLDGDAAGQRAAQRVTERALPLLRPGCSLQFITLPQGEDPDSLVTNAGPAALQVLLQAARPLETVLWEGLVGGRSLDTPERQAALRQAVIDQVQQIGDRNVQTAYRTALLDRYFGLMRARRGATGGRNGLGRRPGRGQRSAQRSAVGTKPLVAGLKRRPVQILLALAVRHPHLAIGNLEELARPALDDRELEALRRTLVDALAEAPDLDSDTLECHLRGQGFSELLDRLFGTALTMHEPTLRLDSVPHEAEARFAYWLDRVVTGADETEGRGATL